MTIEKRTGFMEECANEFARVLLMPEQAYREQIGRHPDTDGMVDNIPSRTTSG